MSSDTQYGKLTVVKSFFRFLVKEDYLPYDPTSDPELPKRKRNLPREIMSLFDRRSGLLISLNSIGDFRIHWLLAFKGISW